MSVIDRSHFDFENQARKYFKFLEGMGFVEIEALSTLIHYRKGKVEVEVYHGRQSYQVGVGIIVSEARYPISLVIAVSDYEVFKQFRYAMATTSEGVINALKKLGILLEHHGGAVLKGDPQFISDLDKQAEQWLDDRILDALVSQLRPQANAAFHQKNYAKAADLFSQIRKSLTPSEVKKLHFSNAHKKIEYNIVNSVTEINDFLKCRGRSLIKDAGVNNYCLSKEDAIDLLILLTEKKISVLGGDVYIEKNGVMQLTYDNWFSDQRSSESKDDYILRSNSEAELYIKNYSDEGSFFAFTLDE